MVFFSFQTEKKTEKKSHFVAILFDEILTSHLTHLFKLKKNEKVTVRRKIEKQYRPEKKRKNLSVRKKLTSRQRDYIKILCFKRSPILHHIS